MKNLYYSFLLTYSLFITYSPIMSIDASPNQLSPAQREETLKNLKELYQKLGQSYRDLAFQHNKNKNELHFITTMPFLKRRIDLWLRLNPGKTLQDYRQYLVDTEQKLKKILDDNKNQTIDVKNQINDVISKINAFYPQDSKEKLPFMLGD